MSSVSSAALAGLRQAELQALAAASNITRLSVEGAKAVRSNGEGIVQTQGPIDLVADSVTLSSAKAQFRACIAVAKMDDENAGTLLNLVG